MANSLMPDIFDESIVVGDVFADAIHGEPDAGDSIHNVVGPSDPVEEIQWIASRSS